MLRDRIPRRRPRNQDTRYRSSRRGFRWRVRWPLVLALLPLVFAAAGTYAALRSDFLSVKDIRVEGARTLDQAALAQISGLHGQSMLTLPVEAALTRLAEGPIDAGNEDLATVIAAARAAAG